MAQQLQRQVHVLGRIKTMNESIYYTVDYIHDAINQNKKVSFKYFEWNENKQKELRHEGKVYLVSPWALTWNDENYYLIAYDSESEKIKHYRVDKMLSIELVDEKRDGSKLFADFDMALYSKRTFGMYGGREENVTLRCKNSLAGKMIDRFGQDVTFIKADSEHFELHVRVHISPLFLTWLMNFGGDVTVVSPDLVRKELVKLASDCISQYDN